MSLFSEGTWTFSVAADIAISGTDRPAFFRSHRSSPSFTYTIDGLAAKKDYDINLGFAEVYWKACKVGKRVMGISINGDVVRSNLDVFDVAGCRAAHMETFSAVPASVD